MVNVLYSTSNKNKKKFHQILKEISCVDHDDFKKILLCAQAAIFCTNNPCGIYNSKLIEETLIDIASKHKINLSEKPKKNSFLHVMTRAYITGGHTRICERWIQSSPTNQTHSVVTTGQGDRKIPALLKKVVKEKSGSFIELKEILPIELSLELRKLGSSYQYIILHTHAYDVVPILAFGTKEFKSPIIFMNHADHQFWLGCSISDLIVNFRKFSVEFTKKRRGIKNNYVLPLPVSNPEEIKIYNKNDLKKSLGFAEDSKVIITMAPLYKFTPMRNLNFIKTIEEILKRNNKAVFIAIGPSKKDGDWKKAFERTNGRINPIGITPNSDIKKYIKIADLSIESFPLGSPTALLDIAKYKVPCIALKSHVNGIDAFDEADIFCNSPSEIIEKALEILDNSNKSNKLYEILKRDSFKEGFGKKLLKLNNALPQAHKVHKVIQGVKEPPTEFEMFFVEHLIQSRKKLSNKTKNFIRQLIYLYILYLPSRFLSKKLYRLLNSLGIV